MPQHWILCMPEDNFLISMKKGLIGLGLTKEKTAKSFEAGDQVVFYLTRKAVEEKSERVGLLRGVAEVTGPAFIDDVEIWHPVKGDIFPYRIPVKFLDTKATYPLKSLIGRLSFIENDLYWALPLQRGHRLVSDKDWKVIMDALQVGVGK